MAYIMGWLLTKYQFVTFFKITCHGIILCPVEKLIDNLTRRIYFIRTYFDLQSSVISIFEYASKVIVRNGQIMNKQTEKVGPTNTTLGGFFVHTMPFISIKASAQLQPSLYANWESVRFSSTLSYCSDDIQFFQNSAL